MDELTKAREYIKFLESKLSDKEGELERANTMLMGNSQTMLSISKENDELKERLKALTVENNNLIEELEYATKVSKEVSEDALLGHKLRELIKSIK